MNYLDISSDIKLYCHSLDKRQYLQTPVQEMRRFS
jgi:hypothetical protein